MLERAPGSPPIKPRNGGHWPARRGPPGEKAEAQHAETGQRPTHKASVLSLRQEAVDSIEHYQQRQESLRSAVAEERRWC